MSDQDWLKKPLKWHLNQHKKKGSTKPRRSWQGIEEVMGSKDLSKEDCG